MNTPFFDAAKTLAQVTTRFFVPGHKGNPKAIPPFGEWLAFDLTEVEGADDLQHPTGPLLQSQQNMAAVYKSGATLYSAAGSTSCIEAMLSLFVGLGGRVVMGRGCHVAAVRALAFLDAQPTWVQPKGGRVAASDVGAALAQSGAKAVYITSPTYEGQISDIPALARVCKAAGAKLLVDNAHGAHLPFVAPPRHPLALGADACADSAHKTLPCLTPAALLHLRDKTLADAGRQALNLYSSTSPAYPVLQSLDLCAGLLQAGQPDFSAACNSLAAVAAAVPHLVSEGDDPLKLCLKPAKGGWRAGEIAAALASAGILPELADAGRVVLMASPYNTQADFALLRTTLLCFAPRPPLAEEAPPFVLPKAVCSVRSALYGPRQTLPTAQAAGKIMAGLHAPCPPGVPLVLPGERITKQAAGALLAGGICHVDVVK